ncbi:MAG: glycosyltransferase family 1 protein [Phycisphaerae bacterium]|nr:glycosyltransferase family 1 protein [Gemmatimonadaceae bacterium]
MPSEAEEQPIRLALFSDTYAPQVNGVTRTLERLRNALTSRGGVVKIFTVADPGSAADEQVNRYPSRPFWAYKELRLSWPGTALVREQMRAFQPTICHLATPFGIGLAGRRVARDLQIPIVSSYHTSFAAYAAHYGARALSGPLWQYLRWFHNSTLRTFCPTQSVVDEVSAHGFQNTSIWSRGVDTKQFSPSHRSRLLRSSMRADDRTLVVTYVGRLAAEKGLDVALRALRIAESRRPGRIVFSCVGDGPYESEVRRAASNSTWLPGKLSGQRLSEAYASGDVFLFPSTTDTFGNVLLEAMASGMPIIGADVGPTRELVGTTRGWLAPAGDAEAFAQILVNLVDAPNLQAQPRAASLEFAQSNTWDTIWDRLFDDYRRIVKR